MKRIALWVAPLVAFALIGMISVAKAEDAKKGTLNVKVTDVDGKAVSGATVKVFTQNAHDEKKAEKQAADAGPTKEKQQALAEGTTGDDGVAKIEIDPGDYTVRANLKGKGAGMAKASAKAGEATDVAITIKPGKGKKAAAAQ